MTARAFERLPIRHKLVAMIMLTSATVLLFASIGHLVSDYRQAREDLRRETSTYAKLILQNSSAALLSRDVDSASRTLRTLARIPELRAACLYDAEGVLFAHYSPAAATEPCPAAAPSPGGIFRRNDYLFTSELTSEGRVGVLYLHSDLATLWARLRTQIAVVALLLGLALATALLLSSRLQALVSEPVMSLARTATEVSRKGDYGLRARRTTEDELGVLVDAFNRMLERIQSREDELSRANRDLRREVAERRRAEHERAELLVREREANRLKDEFLATLSHELRTPLNAILGWTKLLRANAVPPQGVDRALEKVERNAQVQSRLVEDLLEVSRIVSGKLHLEMREVDLVTIVNTAVDSIRPTAEARGVSIERYFALPSMPTIGDADRLQQVVWNLLSNAVKFTPSGGRVGITLQRLTLMDELRVSDTGIGIEPAFLTSVFDTFRQGDASSTRTHGGLGLGLSIVRHLVEMHGGAVEAESQGVNAGATFTVRLPIRTADEQVEATSGGASVELPARRLAGNTVLVVDDDADTRELLISVLDAAGARVHAAGSAADGFQSAIDVRPDALVSDIAMPDQDGYAMLAQITEALGSRSPRVTIALTAFAGERDRAKSAEAGFQRHIAKPFDPLELVRTLEDLLKAKVGVAG
ncbi:MAG TPA: ATP-binding protein [Vicinamibacterales bacterium]|nr:ATP-binding protein [Vicinamibacterales bacterium]